MISLGLDIGGANTKAILLAEGEVRKYWLKHIPLWKKWRKLESFLNKLTDVDEIQCIGVTMTAELSDVFVSKRSGVKELIKTVSEKFEDKTYYASIKGNLLTKAEAQSSPEKIAAANWVATGLTMAKRHPNCITVDVGSTTTDIIPVKKGSPTNLGHDDFQRLKAGELVYTGVLRTPVSSLCTAVNIEGEEIGTASEYFANTGDVYRILEMLDKEEYTCETPDGRGKGIKDCMRRIARIFCADLEEVGGEFIKKSARYFHNQQITLLKNSFEKIMNSHDLKSEVVVTGIGRKILAEKAARASGLNQIVDLGGVYGEGAALMTPAFSMARLAAEEFQNENGS